MIYYGYLYPVEDNYWGVSFPDFPEVATQGASVGEAMAMGKDALDLLVEVYREEGKTPPSPSGADACVSAAERRGREDGSIDGRVPVVFPYDLDPGKSQLLKINFSLRAGELREIDAKAKRLGLSRSALLTRAALLYGE